MIGQLRSHETNRRRVSDNNNISQLLRDSFSVSQQPLIWEPPSHYSMERTLHWGSSNILLEWNLPGPWRTFSGDWPWQQLYDQVQFITAQTARDPCWKIFVATKYFWLCCESMTPTSAYRLLFSHKITKQKIIQWWHPLSGGHYHLLTDQCFSHIFAHLILNCPLRNT